MENKIESVAIDVRQIMIDSMPIKDEFGKDAWEIAVDCCMEIAALEICEDMKGAGLRVGSGLNDAVEAQKIRMKPTFAKFYDRAASEGVDADQLKWALATAHCSTGLDQFLSGLRAKAVQKASNKT